LNQQKRDKTPIKDAMFSKKPITDFCASCESEIKETDKKMGQSQ